MKSLKFDIAVVGGGQPGVCAAIAAAESGSQVVLIQDRPVLGGNASSECCVPAHGAESLGHNRNLRDTGILEDIRVDFYCRYSKDSDIVNYWDILLKERCDKTENLTVLLQTKMFDLKKDGNKIKSIKVLDLKTSETFEIIADYFIDDTGDGVLGFKAGAEFRMGREAKFEFNEKYLGKEKADKYTLGCSIYGWAVKREFAVPFTPPKWAIKYKDCKSLEHRPHGIQQIIPRVTCSRDNGEIVFFWWLEWGGELDVINDQEEIYNHLLAEMFGLWDHLKNHCTAETTKALENYELFRWSAFPLKRESRRLMGDYILSENDVVSGKIFDDEIGYGGWPMDDHPPMGIASKDPACDQLFYTSPCVFPYRCSYSKNIENLFMVGRCVSVTHAALSSIRVINTLSSIAEATGVAAAMCSKYSISPRELGKTKITELQEKIMKRDLFLVGKQGTTVDDKAPKAAVKVSSEASLSSTGPVIGKIDLRYDTALQIPTSGTVLDKLSVKLSSTNATELKWALYCGDKLSSSIPDSPFASGKIVIDEGNHEYSLFDKPVDIFQDSIVTLVLYSNKYVSWCYSDELYGTRWGVDFHGDMKGLAYHGASYVVSPNTSWIWVNGNGRLPGEIALWTRNFHGYKRHDKLYATPCFSIVPQQNVYGAMNITNGITRSYDRPNIWISQKGLPQKAELVWNEPIIINEVELVFDTNLDYSDQRYGFPRAKDDYSIPNVIEETVSGYRVNLYTETGKKISKSVSGNMYRNNKLNFIDELQGEPVKSMDFEVLETRGVDYARVFEIRVH